MRPIAFLLVGIGLASIVTYFLPVPNCSQVSPSDVVPWLWLNTKNPVDEALISNKSNVRTKISETRTFVIRCWALYPILLTSKPFILNNEKHIDQVKMNSKTEYHPYLELFVEITYFVINPHEEFHLEATCMPTCDPRKFPLGLDISTTKQSNNLTKVQIQAALVSKAVSNMGNKWMIVFVYFGGFQLGWGFGRFDSYIKRISSC